MIRCLFAIPGDLSTPTGGYAYARRIIPLLAEEMQISVCGLPSGFPFPSSVEIEAARAALKRGCAVSDVVLFDGLAFGALPLDVLRGLDIPIVALIHHPLGLETGLTPQQSRSLLQSERSALAAAREIVVTSRATAAAVEELFAIPKERVAIAEPGIAPGKRAVGAPPGEPPHIVSVGAITPRKGFDVLLHALHRVRDFPWRTTIAGSLDRDPRTAAAIRSKIGSYALEDRVRLAGPLDEAAISALYASGDLFALASFYEGYGMAFAEAMAHGLPVVASGEGAVADTVPEAAGLICPPGDAACFAHALRRILADRAFRKEKAEGAWRHGQALPRWEDTARMIAGVLKRAVA